MKQGGMIETGNRLEMHRIRHTEGFDDKALISRFLYLSFDGEAVIEMPVSEGVLVALEPGDRFQISFYTNKGIYSCQSEVVGRRYEDKLPVAVMNFQSAFEKLQRRQYYRMECILDLNFRVIEKEELDALLLSKGVGAKELLDQKDNGDKLDDRERFYSGVALDISGGGVRFNAQNDAKVGDLIALQIAFLSVDDFRLQLLFARVLAVVPVQNRVGLYEHRVEFIHISNDEREAIIRYIFLEERNRRKREAGLN